MGEEKGEEIKITDRRYFHADGTPRSEVTDEKGAEAAQPSAGAAQPSAGAAQPSAGAAQPSAGAESAPPPPPLVPAFLEFLTGLVGGAASHLGLVPHPASGKAEVDLDGAKQMIDILAMLEEKTKGNLTPGEKQFLEQALTELRLVYVRVASQRK
jgi:hypothetical protein